MGNPLIPVQAALMRPVCQGGTGSEGKSLFQDTEDRRPGRQGRRICPCLCPSL